MQLLCKSNEVGGLFCLKIFKRVFVILENHIINGCNTSSSLNDQWPTSISAFVALPVTVIPSWVQASDHLIMCPSIDKAEQLYIQITIMLLFLL